MRMKKYLMTTIAVVTMGAAFTSCSHNFDVYNSEDEKVEKEKYSAELVQAEYEAVFEQTFGKPAADQDWGFGDDNASTRAFTRAFTPTHLSSNSSWTGWVSAPASTDYKTSVPDNNIYPMNEYWRNTGTYYVQEPDVEGGVVEVKPYNGNATIYVSGTKKINFVNPSDGAKNVRFYIIPGADVHFTNSFTYQKGANNAMYIAEGAKVTFDKDFSANVFVYNKGTVIVEGVTGPYDNGAIYNDNGGTMTCKNGLNVYNNNSQVINNGSISVTGDVTIQGSGHFRNANDGIITVTGETLVNSNDCSWINDGEYTTDDFTYHAGSTDVINNCMLTVNDLFLINLGDTDKNCFLMNGGAGVEAGRFHFAGPGFIYMGSGSVFKVLGDAKMDATKVDYGIYGPTTGDPAVFHVVGNITTSNTAQGYDITYGNNIAVVATNHFDSETGYTSKSGTYPIIDFSNCTKDVIYTAGAKPAISIPKVKCNPGFEGNETITDLRIICEDLSATSGSDYDFNDVVFDVFFGDAGKAYIEVLAAGGTLPLYINNVEVHCLLLGVDESKIDELRNDKGILPMINTRATERGLYGRDNIPSNTILLKNAIKTRKDCGLRENIKIEVEKNGTRCEITAKIGQAAAKIAVQRDFFGPDKRWLDERVDIKSINNNAFTKFVKGEMKWNQWYK